MKKISLMMMSALLSVALMTGCGENGGKEEEDSKDGKEQKDNQEKKDEASKDGKPEGGDEATLSYDNCEDAVADLENVLKDMLEIAGNAEEGDTEAQIKVLEKAAEMEKIGQAIQAMGSKMTPECQEELQNMQAEYQEKLSALQK